MPAIDLLLLLIVLFMIGAGAARGFVASSLGLAGLIVTAIVAIRAHPMIQNWLQIGAGAELSAGWNVVLFLILFLVVSRAIGWVVRAVLRVFDVVRAIPFTKSIDRMLGAVLGLAQGVILVILLVVVLISVTSLPPEVARAVDASWIVRGALLLTDALAFFFPESWDVLRHPGIWD